jgi:hypothetical protein
MELQINQEIQDIKFDSNILVEEVVSKVSNDLTTENKVICQIKLDDEIIPETYEKEAFQRKISDVTSLKITAEDTFTLVVNGIESLKTLLPELIIVIGKTTEAYRTGDVERAQGLFISTLEALEVVPVILDSVRGVMRLDYNEIKIGSGITLKDLEDKMLMSLKLICDVQAKSDTVGIADTLEYELAPNLACWEEALPILGEICKERTS